MDWFNWSNDEEEKSPQILKFEEIENWIDAEFGWYNYIGIRAYVKSAMDNTLATEYPNSPYTAKEVIQWAEWNDKESFLFTPGGQAIEGEEFSDEYLGTPEINPRTGQKNSQAKQDGKILSTAKKVKSSMTNALILLAIAGLAWQSLSAKVKKGGK